MVKGINNLVVMAKNCNFAAKNKNEDPKRSNN